MYFYWLLADRYTALLVLRTTFLHYFQDSPFGVSFQTLFTLFAPEFQRFLSLTSQYPRVNNQTYFNNIKSILLKGLLEALENNDDQRNNQMSDWSNTIRILQLLSINPDITHAVRKHLPSLDINTSHFTSKRLFAISWSWALKHSPVLCSSTHILHKYI